MATLPIQKHMWAGHTGRITGTSSTPLPETSTGGRTNCLTLPKALPMMASTGYLLLPARKTLPCSMLPTDISSHRGVEVTKLSVQHKLLKTSHEEGSDSFWTKLCSHCKLNSRCNHPGIEDWNSSPIRQLLNYRVQRYPIATFMAIANAKPVCRSLLHYHREIIIAIANIS